MIRRLILVTPAPAASPGQIPTTTENTSKFGSFIGSVGSVASNVTKGALKVGKATISAASSFIDTLQSEFTNLESQIDSLKNNEDYIKVKNFINKNKTIEKLPEDIQQSWNNIKALVNTSK